MNFCKDCKHCRPAQHWDDVLEYARCAKAGKPDPVSGKMHNLFCSTVRRFGHENEEYCPDFELLPPEPPKPPKRSWWRRLFARRPS